MLHGFLNVDKPVGITSHDAVARIRRIAGQKRVGHGGTLDPAATGVLPVALGEATRLVEFLVDGRKRYQATIRLGVTTTTDDAEGALVAEVVVPPLSAVDLERALAAFVGVIRQVPPVYSAIQVNGRRAYDIARHGLDPKLAERQVEIDRIDLLHWNPPLLSIDITCGKGTYIRALARDLGQALGCGAHLHALRRTAVASLEEATAVSLERLVAAPETLADHLLAPEMAVTHLERIDVDDEDAVRLRNGRALDLPNARRDQILRAHHTGRLLALLRYHEAAWRPFKVFGWR